MQIKCPTCGKLTTWQENEFRPFCSERCKLIDLGRWASEQYKVVEPLSSGHVNSETVQLSDKGNKADS